MSKKDLHHAYLVFGAPEDARRHVLSLLLEHEVRPEGNPDFFLIEEEKFGVDEARALIARAQEKAFSGKKVFLIIPRSITYQAQNALLKTFEEPIGGTHFFLVARDESLILPTLRSRMLAIKAQSLASGEAAHALDFLALPLRARLEYAKSFADEEKNLAEFLDSLIVACRGRAEVRNIVGLRRYAGDPSASRRLILEHLALVL